jgi:hypothetical protein
MADGSAWPRRPQEPAHSRRAGPARHDDGERTTAYRALGALACAHCARVMDVGELFSRHALMPGGSRTRGVTLLPLCNRCRPLRLEGDENEAQHEG